MAGLAGSFVFFFSFSGHEQVKLLGVVWCRCCCGLDQSIVLNSSSAVERFFLIIVTIVYCCRVIIDVCTYIYCSRPVSTECCLCIHMFILTSASFLAFSSLRVVGDLIVFRFRLPFCVAAATPQGSPQRTVAPPPPSLHECWSICFFGEGILV